MLVCRLLTLFVVALCDAILLVVLAQLDPRIQIVQTGTVITNLFGERMTALRRQIDVGQGTLTPPGSSARSAEIVVTGIVQSHPVHVVRWRRIKSGRVSEAQNRTVLVILLAVCNRMILV